MLLKDYRLIVWNNRCMGGWIDRYMYGWMVGWMVGWMDGWMDRWID